MIRRLMTPMILALIPPPPKVERWLTFTHSNGCTNSWPNPEWRPR